MSGIEPETSSLPRKHSTPELHRQSSFIRLKNLLFRGESRIRTCEVYTADLQSALVGRLSLFAHLYGYRWRWLVWHGRTALGIWRARPLLSSNARHRWRWLVRYVRSAEWLFTLCRRVRAIDRPFGRQRNHHCPFSIGFQCHVQPLPWTNLVTARCCRKRSSRWRIVIVESLECS